MSLIARAVAIVLLLAAFVAGWWRLTAYYERIGYERMQAEQLVLDQAASAANFKETERRFREQQENQRVQNLELAAARADAARNARDADQLREQNAGVANRWRDALHDSTTVAEREAAADAIGVLADVLGRADRRAGILASYADAARAAGLKCERDYDALKSMN